MASANVPAAVAAPPSAVDHNDYYMSQLDLLYELTRKSEQRYYDTLPVQTKKIFGNI
jgi:hypothetical protein